MKNVKNVIFILYKIFKLNRTKTSVLPIIYLSQLECVFTHGERKNEDIFTYLCSQITGLVNPPKSKKGNVSQQGPLLVEDSAKLGALCKHSLVGIYLLPDQTPQLLSWDPDSASQGDLKIVTGNPLKNQNTLQIKKKKPLQLGE